MSPKAGRPKAEKPKGKKLEVRIDEETGEILEALAQHYGITVSAVVRMAIEKLYAEIKE